MSTLTAPLAAQTQVTGRLAPAWTPAARRAATVLTVFIVLQLVCQIAILIPALSKLRVVFRAGCFLLSLAALVLVRGRGRRHPAAFLCMLALGIVALGFVNPSTNSLLSGLGQFCMYLAVFGPVFWVSRLSMTPAVFHRVVLLLWVFHTLSAVVGVLQIHYPGRFQPPISSIIANDKMAMGGATITLADGQQTFRPMGLTDLPGGAAGSGLYAALFGLGFYLSSRSFLVRVAGIGSMMGGLFCIYLSQVRSILVMLGISAAALMALLARRGESGRLVGVAIVIPIAVVGSFLWAATIGGEGTVRRLRTLTDDSTRNVYYKNRGFFLEVTLTELLPKYPLGAGAGRWGMIYTYFGDKTASPERRGLYAEIQMTGWLYDGGAPLILTYGLALFTALFTAYRITIALPLGNPFAVWAALIVAYNLGAIALTFNYALFNSQSGLEFWLLNAALFGTYLNVIRPAVPAVQPQIRFAPPCSS
jgi:hypothetical protein